MFPAKRCATPAGKSKANTSLDLDRLETGHPNSQDFTWSILLDFENCIYTFYSSLDCLALRQVKEVNMLRKVSNYSCSPSSTSPQ